MGIFTELENSPIGQKLTAAGYSIWNTGGGTMCWGRQTAQETVIYIGQGDGELGEDGKEDDWGTSVSDEDGAPLEWMTVTGTLDHCIAEMAKLDAEADKIPAIGTRVRFIREWEIFSSDTIIKVGEFGTITETDNGTVYILMERHFPYLREWDNKVEITLADFADDNSVTPAGFLLLHVEPVPPLDPNRFTLSDAILDEALNAALVVIQRHLGVTDGGVASQHFSGSGRENFEIALQEYANTEKSYAADEEEVTPRCTYPYCKCIVSTRTSQPEPACPLGLEKV